MNRLFILFMLCAGILTACYEDKGNYDYHPINEVTISGIEESYTREKWDLLEIAPSLVFSLEETDQLAYCWEVNGRKVSEELKLNYGVDVDVADESYKCRFTVISLVDSAKYYQEFNLNVVTPYKKGLMVLSEQDEKAMLSFHSDTYKEPVFDKWVFYNENGKYLEGRPLSLESYNGVLVATSRGNYNLDGTIMKLMKLYDGSTMLEKDPDFEMKFCCFTDMAQGTDFGCIIGTNGRVYTYRGYTDYISTPSPMPIPDYNDETLLTEYELSDKCLVTTMGWGGSMRFFLGYDMMKGRFIEFRQKYGMTYDNEQMCRCFLREPVIGLPLLAIGSWDSGKYASFFYDPKTNVAKVVPSHNHRFQKITENNIKVLDNHHFTSTTILKFCDATRRAIFSSGSEIRQLYMDDIEAPSTVLSDKLPTNVEITCLKVSNDREKLYVGVWTDKADEYKGDLYVLDMMSGAILETYFSAGGYIVDVLEKN